MEFPFRDILDDPDIDFLKGYINQVIRSSGGEVNAARIGTEIYLAKTLKKATTDLERSIHRMTESNEAMAKANEKYAIASEKHAKSLTYATWALFLATTGLIIVGMISIFV